MQQWLNTTCNFDDFEEKTFNKVWLKALDDIENWNEEELKMNFISVIIDLSYFSSTKTIRSMFDRTIEAEVDGIFLRVKPDFTMAKGVMDLIQKPYFHFHEYKKDKEPTKDPLAQLLKAFLIGSKMNQNGKPLYGAYIIGRYWYFVTYENNETRDYCVSPSYDSTKEAELMQIIAILRHFRIILETVLMI